MNRMLSIATVCFVFNFSPAVFADDEKPNDDGNNRRAAAAEPAGRRGEREEQRARSAVGREGDRAAAGRRQDAAGGAWRRGENADGANRGRPGAAIRGITDEVIQRVRGRDGNGDAERLKQEDPEMFALVKADSEMENQTRQLVDQYRRADNDTDREQIRGKLTAIVENHFAVRQQRRELEVKRLEAQLDRLRNSLKKRTEERQKLIDEHLNRLLGDDEAGF